MKEMEEKMKKNICKCMVLTLLMILAVCGSIGVGSLAKGNRGNVLAKDGEADGEEREPEVVEAGQSYAYIEFRHAAAPVLLITDGTYGYNGLEASFNSVVYGRDKDGNWQELGLVAGSGTAYPLRYDKDGIYVTGGHFAAHYSVDWEEMVLVREEYAKETFDESGNVTHVYARDGKKERSVEDNSYLVALLDRYEKAGLVGFRKSEKGK